MRERRALDGKRARRKIGCQDAIRSQPNRTRGTVIGSHGDDRLSTASQASRGEPASRAPARTRGSALAVVRL